MVARLVGSICLSLAICTSAASPTQLRKQGVIQAIAGRSNVTMVSVVVGNATDAKDKEHCTCSVPYAWGTSPERRDCSCEEALAYAHCVEEACANADCGCGPGHHQLHACNRMKDTCETPIDIFCADHTITCMNKKE